MSLWLDPFLNYEFMQQALWIALFLSMSAAPLGAFVVLRRLSLVGDTLAHGILPGVAIAFALYGFSIAALSAGAVMAGLLVAFFSGLVVQKTKLKEDASFASFYLISLAVGTCLISVNGSNLDLIHFLFGNLLAVPAGILQWIAVISLSTLAIMLINFQGFVGESFDPAFMRVNKLGGNWHYFLFLFLFVVNIVASFFALGTLLSLGLFILPTIICKLWVRAIPKLIAAAIIVGALGSYGGLLLSFYQNLPAGPSIVLMLGIFYLVSILSFFIRQHWTYNRFQKI